MAFKTTEARYGLDDPRLSPAYSVAEAAHYLRMPEGTLRSWVAGRWYPVAGKSKRSRPLIHLDDSHRQYLSFINLVEAHVLAAIRRRHGVKLPKVRAALDYVKRQFTIERPLIDQTFQTEIAALRASNARVFVLTAGNLRGIEIAAVFLSALPRICGILNSLPGPFIAHVSQSGHVTIK